MATLKDLFKTSQTRTLPNQGGSYSIGLGGAPITMDSIFPSSPASPSSSNVKPAPVAPQPVVPAPVKAPVPSSPSLFSQPKQPVVAEEPAPVNIPQGYINPATGQLYSAKEIVANMAKKIPLTNAGDIGKYAGDALAAPDQSVEDLTKTARNLAVARNDIAVGATDPFKVGKDSGIAYSPAQLATIEKAYAGIYDPAINDVFARIKEKQELDKKLAEAKSEEAKLKAQKELEVFRTNENIRQYKETTGKGKGGGGDKFTQTQINDGASNAGIGIADFEQFDDDVKNFYINPPMVVDEETNKSIPKYKVFENLLAEVSKGKKTPEQVIELIKGSSTLPGTVKQYFISKMPIAPEEKQTHWYDIFTDWM
jgi:hypothetical protein